MDSLTQIVLGAAVGEAVLGKKIGARAMLWGAIAGTIPDLDVYVKFFTDPITSAELHRGISHSLLFSIVMAPVLGWCVRKSERWSLVAFLLILASCMCFDISNNYAKCIVGTIFTLFIFLVLRKQRNQVKATQWDWIKLFFLSLVTHPLLDAHTDWGTQFFWPFDLRLAYKNISVVDPIYTIPFLVFTIIALCYKRTNPKRAIFNYTGIIISSLYMLITFVFKGIGIQHFKESLAKQELSYIEMDTRPTFFNSILWNAQIETENGYRMGYYSLFDSKTDINFSPEFPKNHHLLEKYKEVEVVKQLIHISKGWYSCKKIKDGILFSDLRFGMQGFSVNERNFKSNYLIYEENGQVKARSLGFTNKDPKLFLKSMLKRIEGN